MRIVVTGAAGYIGSVLCPMLEMLGHEVRKVDLKYGMDVRTQLGSDQGWAEAEAVIPLAAIVGAPACSRAVYDAVTVNTDAISLLLGSLPAGTKVVFPATDSGYPSGAVDENSLMQPKSLYARTKYESEQVVLSHGGVSLRLASVFGLSPSMRWDLMVHSFVKHAVLHPDRAMHIYELEYIRNFVHIYDVCQAFIHALSNYDKMRGEAYNVANPALTMSKFELCCLIREYIPTFMWAVADGVKDPDRRDCVVSSSKLIDSGWAPKVSMVDGIFTLIDSIEDEFNVSI